MQRWKANVLLLGAGAIWGMGFVAQSTAMHAMGPWTYTAAKFGLAALVIAPFALVEKRQAARPLGPRMRLGFLGVGLALFLGAITQQIGMLTTSVTNAGFLTGLYVVLTPFLAFVLLRHRPHWVVWPAALASFCGIVLLSGGGSPASLSSGDLWVVACALFFALQILFVGVYGRATGRPMALSFAQFATAAVVGLLGMLLLEEPKLAHFTAVWPQIVYGGAFSTGVAFTLQTVGQRHTSPAQAAIFLSSEALFAALFGAILLAERIPPSGFLGAALIFAAMLAVEIVPVLRARRLQPVTPSQTASERPAHRS